MAAEAVLSTLRHVWQCLDSLPVPKALVGGLALGAWDHPRSTKDVDLLIALSNVRAHAMLAHLGAAGFRSKGRTALIRVGEAEFFQLLYEPPDAFIQVQVDLLIAGSEFQSQALARSVPLHVPEFGFDVAVLRCDDLIIMKLLAGRLIDRADAVALLHANRDDLDLGDLAGWVHKLHLERSFSEAWAEAFSGDALPF
jgi:Nucleotidyl transferase AbiEii toxin, Type IV TA system